MFKILKYYNFCVDASNIQSNRKKFYFLKEKCQELFKSSEEVGSRKQLF